MPDIAGFIQILEPVLVGMWRFRKRGEPKKWACTYTIDGYYYDTYPQKTLKDALLKVFQVVKRRENMDLSVCEVNIMSRRKKKPRKPRK